MGTCKHGDDCKFAHGEHEPERPIDWEEKPKSRFCSHFRERRFCQFGRYCVFAHAEEELQEGDRRKTLLCKQYFEGGCNRGGNCAFAHGETEQRQPPGWQEKPKMKLCEKFPNFCEFGRYCHNAHGQEGDRRKTLLCKQYFEKGCNRGGNCAFAHGETEQRQPPGWQEKPKMKLCEKFPNFCEFGRYCHNAHGQ
ncbi:unnamed protein product, partial [Effrenium voratum]